MPTNTVRATVECLSDPKCQARFATNAVMVPHQNNYPLVLESLLSDLRATPDGFRLNLQITVTNPTDRHFGPFEMVVSPAVLRQGEPILPPPVLLVHVDSLEAKATGVFYVDDVTLPPPEGGKFGCLNRDFGPHG